MLESRIKDRAPLTPGLPPLPSPSFSHTHTALCSSTFYSYETRPSLTWPDPDCLQPARTGLSCSAVDLVLWLPFLRRPLLLLSITRIRFPLLLSPSHRYALKLFFERLSGASPPLLPFFCAWRPFAGASELHFCFCSGLFIQVIPARANQGCLLACNLSSPQFLLRERD